MGVVIEKSEEFVFEFGEFLLVGETGIVLEVIVEQVDGLGLE
jgi:hypothetical protein